MAYRTNRETGGKFRTPPYDAHAQDQLCTCDVTHPGMPHQEQYCKCQVVHPKSKSEKRRNKIPRVMDKALRTKNPYEEVNEILRGTNRKEDK